MIIPESEKSDSSRYTARSPSSLAPSDAPLSPPPYSATIASGDDSYQDHGHSPSSGGFAVPYDSMSNANAPPAPCLNLPPRCNHLVERKVNSGVKGTWHVDTALQIPERLLPPITEFDGAWNREIQKARKEREKDIRRRDSSWRSNTSTSPLPPLVEVRPNLMLANTNGSISSEVHVVSSDGVIRPTTIVAEGTNGSIALKIHAAPDQPLRVFASSTNGSITVRVPSSFEGAVMMSTTWGSVKISDSIKAKLTTFSSTSNTTRCFVGDWQALGFGSAPETASDPNVDPPLPTIQPISLDPFASWNGPVIHITSTNGSVSLGSIEDTPSEQGGGLSRAFRNLMNSFFGGGGGNDGHDGSNGSPSNQPPPPTFNPSESGSNTYPRDVKYPVPGGVALD